MVSGLRKLGVGVLIGGASAEVIRIGAGLLLYFSVVPGGDPYAVSFGIGLWWPLVGCTVLGFAQIVEHGRTLRLELDEVI